MEFVDCKDLALKKVKISGDLVGKFGTFEIEQVFVNNTKNVLEVNYTFPIVETATVTGFFVTVGNKCIKGVCKEKDEAIREYHENIVKGNSAYMLNQDANNIFNISVGKVNINEEVHVKITYIDIFQIVDNNINLIIPTLVYPRYNSEITDDLIYGKVDYTVDFNINASKTLNIASITSQSHNIKINEDENKYIIESLNYDMSSDFVLSIKLKEELNSNAVFSKMKNGENVVCLSFMPEIEEQYEDTEKEYIFIIDVSGSMVGKKLDETKKAVKECLKQLDNGDKVNLIPFGTTYTAFEIESVEYNEENLKRAEIFIDSLVARGGTEILMPIKFALYEPSDDKVILLFTDGQVGNEDQILNFVSGNIENSKLFAFGIDYNINTSFIRKLGKVGNGKSEFITPGEKIDEKIIRTFARIQTPIFKNLTIDYGTNKVLDEIREDNSLFNYEFYNVVAKLEKIEDDIILKGEVLEKTYEWRISKEDIKEANTNLEKVYAKLQIDRLEEYVRVMPVNKEKIYIKKIIDISTEYNIATKYTTFISVYERENKLFEIPQVQNIVLSDAHMEKSSANVRIGTLDIPTFLRKTKRNDSVSMDIAKYEDSNYKKEIYLKELKEELIKYYNHQEVKSVSLFILFTIYFIKNNITILSDEKIISFLENNIKEITKDNMLLDLLYVLYLNSNNDIKNFIDKYIFTNKYKKIIETSMEYIPRFKYEKIVFEELKENIESKIEDVLFNINNL